MDTIVIAQAVLSGLAAGSVYALVGLSFSITFTTSRTLNFSQGEFVSAGAFLYVGGLALLGLDKVAGTGAAGGPVAMLLGSGVELLITACALAAMAVVGAVLYFSAIRPFLGSTRLSWVISTVGFGIVLQSAGLALLGPGVVKVPSPVGDALIVFWGVAVRPQELLVIGVACAAMLALHWLHTRTMVGKIMRAVAHSGPMATLMGIDVMRVTIAAFAVSAMLAALSGMLIAPIATASIFLGLGFGLKGFSAAIVGGLMNPRGCVIAALSLGVMESLVNLWQAQWRDVVIFGLVIVVLAVRPNGLFGTPTVDKA